MSNVIDFKSRQKLNATGAAVTHAGDAPVIDMTEKRNEIINSERRRVRRTILSEFLSAFVLVPRRGLMKVNLYDISENGLAFETDLEAGRFQAGEELAMRVYLSNDTYFAFTIDVANVREIGDESTYRHGAVFRKDSMNQEALTHFVRFVESVSASLQTDRGDIVVSSLAR